jgi:hypothetical protein
VQSPKFKRQLYKKKKKKKKKKNASREKRGVLEDIRLWTGEIRSLHTAARERERRATVGF